MKPFQSLFNFLVILSYSMLGSAVCANAQENHVSAFEYPFQNNALSAEERAEDLVGRLTLGEKVGLMTNESQPVERFGIKPYNWWNEALHGVARAGLATVYPQAIGMAATFDTLLVRRVFSDVSDEARAKHAEAGRHGERGIYQGLTFWTPDINIFRDPRWGRGQETYGEDPYLTSRMAVAVIEGLQGGSPAERAAGSANEACTLREYDKLHACAKHFAVHSGPEWNRHTFNIADLSSRDLYETYLPAFKAAVTEAGVKEVMCSYNGLDGQPCCGNSRLLTKILRDDWHFDGIVVSDCGAVSDFYAPWGHKSYPDSESASTAALKAGTDITCMNEFSSLFEAVKDGKINESELDARVRKLMRARFELGEMDPDSIVSWQHIPYSNVSSPEHLSDALDAARESIVLLQNVGSILPLSKAHSVGNPFGNGGRIAVCGANATDSTMQWGNYNGTPGSTVTILQGIRDKLGTQVPYVQGCPLVKKAAAVRCLSDEENSLSMRDAGSIDWNSASEQVMQSLEAMAQDPSTSRQVKILRESGLNMSDMPRYLSSGAFNRGTSPANATVEMDSRSKHIIDSLDKAGFPMSQFVHSLMSAMVELRKGLGNVSSGNGDIPGENTVKYDFCSQLDSLRDVDLVIYVGGISPRLEGEEMPVEIEGFRGGDRTSIELPQVQRSFLQALKAAGKKVIFVDCSGSAIAMVPEVSSCDAILQAWYPGQEGGTAVADVLFGDFNPSGKLPVTFYRNDAQLNDYENYSMSDSLGRTYRYFKGQPLFPFGYGLSYSKFSIGKAKLEDSDGGYIPAKGTKKLVYQASVGSGVVLRIPVKNFSDRDGVCVVEVYMRNVEDKGGPVKSLRAFSRVYVPAKGSAEAVIALTPSAFETFDAEAGKMSVRPGRFEVLYGASSADADLQSVSVQLR